MVNVELGQETFDFFCSSAQDKKKLFVVPDVQQWRHNNRPRGIYSLRLLLQWWHDRYQTTESLLTPI